MISACVVVYKEESIISGMIENISSLINELILLHDGKVEDDTFKNAQKVCEKLNIDYKFIQRPRKYVAEPHRPYSFECAKNDWVLWIDADERLDGNIEVLKSLVNKDELSLIKFRWGTKKELESDKFNKTKSILFRKSKCYYIGIPHQKPRLISGDVLKAKNVDLLHLEERRSFIQILKRNIRWSKIIVSFYFSNISDINILNEDEYIVNTLNKEFEFKKSYVVLRILLAPFKAMLISIKEKNSLKLTLLRGINVLVLNCMILYYKIFR